MKTKEKRGRVERDDAIILTLIQYLRLLSAQAKYLLFLKKKNKKQQQQI